ncbi:probable pre-mRNA-splicing factor ATP-dependent RNA helicase mog-4 [Eurosta solidaginis]|uniref:probable pre-mRNA-splicing factor ATP-dependent RNA helicase mog-4 n=1 Tax=Eurosta solidaginis TaxID=178769 RepID=UPI003530A81F
MPYDLKKVIARFRPELKLLISSVTLDADKFSKLFDDAPIFRIQDEIETCQEVLKDRVKRLGSKDTSSHHTSVCKSTCDMQATIFEPPPPNFRKVVLATNKCRNLNLEQLYTLGALNHYGELTKLGRRMAEFPIDPMMGKCVGITIPKNWYQLLRCFL